MNAWLIEQDMLDVVESHPIALVAETRCSFTAPLAFPQAIEVGLALAALGRSSIRYRIGIFAQGADTAAAQGEFLHVVVDRANHCPVSVPPSWREKLQLIR